jgi:hypothetical protein
MKVFVQQNIETDEKNEGAFFTSYVQPLRRRMDWV